MNISEILMLLGIIIVNGSALLATWIKLNKDIAIIQTKVLDLEVRIQETESRSDKNIKDINTKMDSFIQNNNLQHEKISDKLDDFKTCLNDMKIEITKLNIQK